MGMPGHAAIIKTDGSVFAHIHHNGSMAMAAFMMANPQSMPGNPATDQNAGMNMAGVPMTQANLPAVVGFPYGFPSAGRYRIFVQMKHSQTIETGVFDVDFADATGH